MFSSLPLIENFASEELIAIEWIGVMRQWVSDIVVDVVLIASLIIAGLPFMAFSWIFFILFPITFAAAFSFLYFGVSRARIHDASPLSRRI